VHAFVWPRLHLLVLLRGFQNVLPIWSNGILWMRVLFGTNILIPPPPPPGPPLAICHPELPEQPNNENNHAI
jgi:hypothetical protein